MEKQDQPQQSIQPATQRDPEDSAPKSILTPAHPSPASMPKWIAALILIVIAAGLIFGVLSSLKDSKSSKQAEGEKIAQVSVMPTSIKVTVAPDSSDSIINQVTAAIKKDSELSAFIKSNPEQNSLVWTDTDGFNIYVEKSKGVNVQIPDSGTVFKEPIKSTTSSKFHKLVGDVMKNNGLSLNPNNSSSSIEDNNYYNYTQAYEGKGIRCVAITAHDISSAYGSDGNMGIGMGISCVNDADFREAHDVQQPFLMGLNDKRAVVNGIRIKNNLAHVGVSQKGAMGGASGFMYKVGNDWKKALIAQAVPMCDELVKNNVPQEFWMDCYEGADYSHIRTGNPGWNF